MAQVSGILNVYFPFELRNISDIRYIRRLYDNRRDRQIKRTRHLQRPRTDLMDKVAMRQEVESVLTIWQKLMGGKHDPKCEPYATLKIAQAYHKEREDNLFVKEVGVILSQFCVVCPGVNSNNAPLEGKLFYFNNLANFVGTYLLAIKLENLSVDDVLRLKHAFYKRAQVCISEFQMVNNVPVDTMNSWMTFPEYICKKAVNHFYYRKTDIDCRARYSFLEINNDGFNRNEICGLLTANEKYYLTNWREPHDYSREPAYSIFYDLRNALLVNHTPYNATRLRQQNFFSHLSFAPDMILPEALQHDDWIAGLEKNKFPKFLKSVELHLLTNNVRRHETIRHDISYFNPIKILKRQYRLWNILYELDVSHCFIDNDMMNSFGVLENLKLIRNESIQLRNHITNYIIVILTFFTILIPIISFIIK